MKKFSLIFVMLVATWAFTACNNATKEDTAGAENAVENAKDETIGTEQQVGDTSAKMDDAAFMAKAASGGMMEVELGKLAQQKAKSARVKNFGAMMVKDHTQANNELKALASTKSVSLPSAMTGEHQNHVNGMREKTGADFDKSYISMMVDDHQKDVNDFEGASNNATDANLKAFAAKTLPVLRTHLDSAKAIHDGVK